MPDTPIEASNRQIALDARNQASKIATLMADLTGLTGELSSSCDTRIRNLWFGICMLIVIVAVVITGIILHVTVLH